MAGLEQVRTYGTIILSILTIFLGGIGHTQTIKISLYNEYSLNSLVITVDIGQYEVSGDDSILFPLDSSNSLYIRRIRDQLSLRDVNEQKGLFRKIELRSIGHRNAFHVRPVLPSLPDRKYDGDLNLMIDLERMLIINLVSMNDYIAGVVKAEGGEAVSKEYYKTQAIISRTYAYSHLQRHEGEGFHLCDGVHCQAYHGKCDRQDMIWSATQQTSGLVLADRDSSLITAAFHANCGGITASAESVWLRSTSYLVPVVDPYCRNGRNAVWEKTIPLEKWTAYLSGYGIKPGEIGRGDLAFRQDTRKEYYSVSKIKIPTEQIRTDWNLRSAFFSVEPIEDRVVLYGRGYGHGIGLCQEGAIEMARAGKDHSAIIGYYYRDVSVVPVNVVMDTISIPGEKYFFKCP